MDVNQLFARIVEAAPGFRPTMAEHIADHDELLPHLLMADCGRYIASFFTGAKTIPSDAPSERELRDVLSVIDLAMTDGNEETYNVVAVSFVEHLWLEPYYSQLYPLLGAGLRAEIDRQRRWESETR